MNKLWFAMIIKILLMPYEENTLMTWIMKIMLLVEKTDVLNITENYGSHKTVYCTMTEVLQHYWSDVGVSNLQGVQWRWSKKWYESLTPCTPTIYYSYIATVKTFLRYLTGNTTPCTSNWNTNLMAEICTKLKVCQQYIINCYKSLC